MTNSPAAGVAAVAVTFLVEGVSQMMWHARPKLLAAAAAALILTTAGVAVQGRQGPAPANATANQALARKQLVLIDQALDTLRALAQHGRVNLADPAFSLWGRRRLETLHKTGAGKAEIIAALEKEIDFLQHEEAIAKARKESAQGTEVEICDVQFRRLEAEIWLNEEKSR